MFRIGNGEHEKMNKENLNCMLKIQHNMHNKKKVLKCIRPSLKFGFLSNVYIMRVKKCVQMIFFILNKEKKSKQMCSEHKSGVF